MEDTARPTSRGLARFALVVVLAALIGIVGYVVGAVRGFDVTPVEEYERIGPATIQSIRTLAELTTVEMVEYTTVEKGEDHGWLDWARGDHISMFAVARIGAGIDLDELNERSFSVNTETGAVRVRLPAAKITYVALDNQATHVYDRDTGIFTRGNPQLEAAARLAAEEVLVQSALDSGILARAEEAAEKVITRFLTGLGYSQVTISAAS